MRIILGSKITRIALVLVLSMTLLSFDNPSDRFFEISKNMEILSSVYAEVNKYYVDEVDPNTLMETGIDAMLKSLDPYTNYIPEDDIEDFRFISTGQYGGIGSVVGNRDGNVTILLPYEGFPASKAGLKVGDVITHINEIDVQGKGTTDISKLLKGQAGTQVDLTIKRYGKKVPFKVSVIREKITVDNVPYYGMIDDEIGYFKLTTFTNNASKNVEKAVKDLKGMGAKKLIFDLRGNTGGLLKEAINICNLFVPKGKEVVSTRGKAQKWNATHKAMANSLDTDIPLVILTNGRSASASEIVSGVIQDYDRGVLIGKKTFGKGLVQATFQTAYHSQVKITTAKYYIPSGRCIQAIDYSNRDKNGKALEIPDSLLVSFKTANGRTVYDGEGITPDIEVEYVSHFNIIEELDRQNMFFYYANKYYDEHETIAPAKEFELSDQEFDDFVSWLGEQDFDYMIPLESKLVVFEEELAKDSLHLHISNQLREIEKQIADEKHEELLESKSLIKEGLELEITKRFYLNKGIIESSFDDDQDILEALAVLKDEEQYNKILNIK